MTKTSRPPPRKENPTKPDIPRQGAALPSHRLSAHPPSTATHPPKANTVKPSPMPAQARSAVAPTPPKSVLAHPPQAKTSGTAALAASLRPSKPLLALTSATSVAPTVVKRVLIFCVPHDAESVTCKLSMQSGGKALRLTLGATIRVENGKEEPIEIKVTDVRTVNFEKIIAKAVTIEHTSRNAISVATSIIL